MATLPAGTRIHRDRAQLAISALVIALAAFVFWQSQLIPADGGYSAIGPRFTPLIIAAGLLVTGLMMLRQALTAGGWRGMEGAEPAERFYPPAFLWIVGGLALHMIVIGQAGFTLASTMLFTLVARGFGSQRVVHVAVIGFMLAAAVFLFFTRVLNLALPASPLGLI